MFTFWVYTAVDHKKATTSLLLFSFGDTIPREEKPWSRSAGSIQALLQWRLFNSRCCSGDTWCKEAVEWQCLKLNAIPWLLLALYNFGFTVLCLQHTMYGQNFLCACTGKWSQCRDVLVQWKYRPDFDTGKSGTSIRLQIHPDLYLHWQALLKTS